MNTRIRWAMTALLLLVPLPALARPKLGVLVVFDQLRAVELERYAPLFGAGGFGGIDGASFDAIYGYAATETGPGHATLATGANPSVHGIALNTWFEPNGDAYAKQYVVDDPRFPVLGAAADAPGRSAQFLAAPTLGDAMKIDSHDGARVVSISLKDRAAILGGGRSADLAIWYEPAQGRFTTSSAYASELPAWLADLGAALPARALDAPPWVPLPVPPAFAFLEPADDRPGEAAMEGLSRTFPHTLKDQPLALQRKLYRLMPQSMEDLVDLALRATDEFKLGGDDEPDLLVVSISTTDYVGHNFGPDSREQLDTLRRADVAVRRLLAGLEKRVGLKGLVVAVSSDHGSSPPPLAVASSRVQNGIVATSDLAAAAQGAVASALPRDTRKRVLAFNMPQVFLDTNGLPDADARRVVAAVKAALQAVPGVAHVYDMSMENRDDAFAPLMAASAYPGRHGQLFIRTLPRFIVLESKDSAGTDHGSAYLYDRRVPLLLAGPGVRRGRYAQPVDPRDVAPTLAFLLGVPPPDACQGRPVPAVGAP